LRQVINRFVEAYDQTAAAFDRTKAVAHPSEPQHRYSDLFK
jgi:hypothetical protein